MGAMVPTMGGQVLLAPLAPMPAQVARKINVAGHFKLFSNIRWPETLIMVRDPVTGESSAGGRP